MKILLASIVLTAFAFTQANSFQTPVHLTTLHRLAKVGGLKNGNRDIRPKITGGTVVGKGLLPFQAGLLSDSQIFCGATIIHESYVLTAATCVDGGQSFTVYVGETDLKKDASSRQSVTSHEVISHEKYDPNGFSYDIALIRLPNPLTFNVYINYISLPPSDSNGNSGDISGWGSTGNWSIGGDLSPILRYASVNIISNEDCKIVYGDIITDSLICTMPKDNKEGACFGDAGGPLVTMFDSGSRLALAGIGTFANNHGCGVGPDGYTRVSTFVDWIKSHIE
ncbi:brachyurin-like [Ischnura elegans]|uniref:brachyurin-like n=1 Tax=Ischnura elegans TaxID=197161 RepID=UPI001ED8A64E|nr:brachyurin-like [Ischnura elegans]